MPIVKGHEDAGVTQVSRDRADVGAGADHHRGEGVVQVVEGALEAVHLAEKGYKAVKAAYMERQVTRKDAAKSLGVSPSTFDKWLKQDAQASVAALQPRENQEIWA